METQQASKPKWSRQRRLVTWIVGGVLGVAILGFAALFVYVKFIKEDAPKKFDESSLDQALDATTTTASGATTTTIAGTATTGAATTVATGGSASGSVDGTWNVAADSVVGYRVKEVLAGLDTEAAGRSSGITGTMTISGTSLTATELTVDMTTFSSDDGRRDSQFNGRIMDVSKFPTATFKLTAPVEIGTMPTDGSSVTVEATGDLTLHGVTKSVVFDLTAKETNGRIGVVGSTHVVFADYSIPTPSNGFAETGDNGTLELQLLFDKA
jgi:polyisoprenoid-binding protein YceI